MIAILLAEFWNDLRAHRTRAFLTLFAVFWGTLTVVLLLAFGEGLKRAAVEGMLGAGNRVFRVYGGQTTVPFEGLPGGRTVRLTEADLELIRRRIPDVGAASASYGRSGTVLETDAERTTTFMEGVHPAFEELRSTYPAAGGRFVNLRDVEERRRVVFLGDSIATRLFPGLDPVGRTLHIDDVPFTVIGVMRSKLQTSMSNGPDADRAIIPASTFRTLYGYTFVSHLLIRPRDVSRAAIVEREIYEVLGRRHRFHPDDARALSFWDFIEEERLMRRIALGIQIFLGLVGALTLIVAGIGVANIMYVVVRERTREIGIKRAVGARRSHIGAQFLGEALLIALLGGSIGLLTATGIVTGVAALPDTNEAMVFIGNPRLSWPIGVATVTVLVAIGLLAGIFPARRAAQVAPVESLRYE